MSDLFNLHTGSGFGLDVQFTHAMLSNHLIDVIAGCICTKRNGDT
jgi:hypothetical protein